MAVSSKAEAQQIAEHYIRNKIFSEVDTSIVDEHTIETDFGWVFFWNSTEYLATGDIRNALAGNVPLIVDRQSGSVYETSTAEPIDSIIERYRAEHTAA